MLRETVRENIYLSADKLGLKGKKVSNILEVRYGETNGHGSIAYRFCVNSENNIYAIRIDHVWDPVKGESLTIWHKIGRFNHHELPLPQCLRLQTWWTINHPKSLFKIARSEQGDLVIGVKKLLKEFDEDSLIDTIDSLVDSIPQVKQELYKKFN